MHHDPDNQSSTNQHDSQHREAGDGRQFPHIRRLLHRRTYWLHKKNLNCCTERKESKRSQKVSCIFSFTDSLSYMCCMRGSLGTACMMHTADTHPNLSSKTRNCHTDLHTEKHQRSSSSLCKFNFFNHSLGDNESKLGLRGFMSTSRAKHFHDLWHNEHC